MSFNIKLLAVEPIMPRHILSLDYDGNACILFSNDMEEGTYKSYIQDNRNVLNIILAIRAAFNRFIDEKIEGTEGVDLYVGSNRQDHYIENYNQQCQNTGFCFKNYDALAKVRGWSFQKFLLGDRFEKIGKEARLRESPLASGTTMSDPSIRSPIDPKKILLITEQLKDIARNHPNEACEVYFTDDDFKNVILSSMAEHFTEHPEAIPPGITLHLIKYDWFETLETNSSNPPQTPEEIASLSKKTYDLIQETGTFSGSPLPTSPHPSSLAEALWPDYFKTPPLRGIAGTLTLGCLNTLPKSKQLEQSPEPEEDDYLSLD
jgi:hypothetical protein